MRIHPRSQAVGEFCAWINPTGRECPLRACLRRPVCVHRTGRGFGRQVNASAYWFRTPRLENTKASFRDSRSTSLVNQLVSNSSARKCESKLSGLSLYVARKKRRLWRRCVADVQTRVIPFSPLPWMPCPQILAPSLLSFHASCFRGILYRLVSSGQR